MTGAKQKNPSGQKSKGSQKGHGSHTPNAPTAGHRTSRAVRILLWVLAVVFMLGSATYQRMTGPTRPVRGSVVVSGESISYKLLRSDWSYRTNEATHLYFRDPFRGKGRADLAGEIHYRRFRSDEPFTSVPLVNEELLGERAGSERQVNERAGVEAAVSNSTGRATDEDEPRIVATLPPQPSAGKLEYFVTLTHENEEHRLPESGEVVVIRYKDHVPLWILIPHVAMMFFAVLFGMRAGLGALFGPTGMKRQAWVALVGMTIGGMILGPIVQKHAFGAYWTGFPFGGDWTDNKTLVMWLVWVVAAIAIGRGPRPERAIARVAVAIAALVMTSVYLIPHSTRGSELDYSKIEQGVRPEDAIQTGR
ncbi:MAG: hypothetical protein H6682_18955 [Candidatus Eisenbacteria bacterium]|nr:hypothetical protein [Candidatus Eisenbacteria bacterium]